MQILPFLLELTKFFTKYFQPLIHHSTFFQFRDFCWEFLKIFFLTANKTIERKFKSNRPSRSELMS